VNGVSRGEFGFIIATDQPPAPGNPAHSLARARSALAGVVTGHRGAWVAATSDEVRMPGSSIIPVRVPAKVLTAHRTGHCATTLTGTYFSQYSVAPPQRSDWLAAYQHVNAAYARAIGYASGPGATVWLHGLALQLVPSLLRRSRPDLRIGVSLHSPFPPAESFLALAGREELIAGLASSDLLSFLDTRSAGNFAQVMAELLPAETGPTTTVLPMPADTATMAQLAATQPIRSAAARIRAALSPAATIFLSTGGLEPGDGTLHRLTEFGRLLDTGELDPNQHTLIHLAPVSGDFGSVPRNLRLETERITAQINGKHGRPGSCPVHYQRGDFTAADMAGFYLAADVMLATPMRDRVTPHAAEYAACRADGHGRVIISEFSVTGPDLLGATVVNPHEPGALGSAMVDAARSSRTASAATTLAHQQALARSVGGWANDFLGQLSPADFRYSPPEGKSQRGQASETSSQLTATGPHP
jgi:trehalose 6-phosphate synthase